jgi:hypothetical protein
METGNGKGSESGQPKEIVITITLRKNGDLNVHGFPKDRILTYGMLGLAKETVDRFFEEAEKGNPPETPKPQPPLIHRIK